LKQQEGVTLFEMLLVMAIIAMISLMTFRFYQQSQLSNDIDKLQYNVDQLFQALGQYYKANCIEYTNPGPPVTVSKAGLLDPRHTPAPTDPFPINIQNDLITPGYLTSWQPINSLVNNASSVNYVVQFNKVVVTAPATPVQVNACIVLTPGSTCVPSPPNTANLPTGAVNSSQIIIWRPQVAVLLNDPTTAALYQTRMAADCISSLDDTGSFVDKCSSSPTAGGYLVWERLPSAASPNAMSNLWLSMPLLKQFNMQYTHDQMYELNSSAGQQYYLCGG
jgi:prepilin-type N-terminal cleavage/methylation domain-containing protein